MKKPLSILAFLLFSIIKTYYTYAEIQAPDYTRFEKKVEIKVQGIITPKVVRFKTNEYFGNNTVLLNDKGDIISHQWISKYKKIQKQQIKVSEATPKFEDISPNNKNALIDGNPSTTFTFHPEKKITKKVILTFSEKTNVSGIYVQIADGIIPPNKISIRGKFDKNFVNIINQVKFKSRLPFPTVSVKALEIIYETPHYLSLAEIEILGQKESQKLINLYKKLEK